MQRIWPVQISEARKLNHDLKISVFCSGACMKERESERPSSASCSLRMLIKNTNYWTRAANGGKRRGGEEAGRRRGGGAEG